MTILLRLNTVTDLTHHTLIELEAIEAEAWVQLQRSLPPDVHARLGIDVRRRGDSVLFIASGTRELAINKVMGLGLGSPLTERALDEVVAEYARAAVERFIIQWHPSAQPAAAVDWFAARGFVLISHIAKMCRPLGVSDARQALASPFLIDEISVDDAAIFEEVVARSLGVPVGLEAGIRSTIGQPGWRYYLARDAGRPIAGGASYVRGEHAWLGFGATIESERRRGAQTALLARRMRDAAADGCLWVSADTLVETPTRPNQSYRNMRRMGFAAAYERPNFVLDTSATTATSPPGQAG